MSKKRNFITIFGVFFLVFFIVGMSNSSVLACDNDELDWGVDRINAEVVWGGYEDAVDISTGRAAFTGQGVNIAIIDFGIDLDHPDLVDNIKGGACFVPGVTSYEDRDGHGTLCAGIIAAADNGEGMIGVAPDANLYALSALCSDTDPSEITWYGIDYIVDAVEWCVNTHEDDIPDNDIHVISMSLSMYINPQSSNSEAEALFETARDKGIVVVAASGNQKKWVEYVNYPACLDTTIAVGATDDNDERMNGLGDRKSNYGEDLDLMAPGVDIKTTALGGGYAVDGGTSFACPMVSGTVALMLEAKPDLTPSDVKNILCNTATDLGDPGWDEYYGYGLVNTDKAVKEVLKLLDSDEDGLRDYYEIYLWGTNPDVVDSDGDGWTDAQECAIYGTNALSSSDTPLLDHDGDGIITKDEVDGFFIEGIGTRYTNPDLFDTDFDGFSDGYEKNPALPFETPSDPTDPFSTPNPFIRW